MLLLTKYLSRHCVKNLPKDGQPRTPETLLQSGTQPRKPEKKIGVA